MILVSDICLWKLASITPSETLLIFWVLESITSSDLSSPSSSSDSSDHHHSQEHQQQSSLNAGSQHLQLVSGFVIIVFLWQLTNFIMQQVETHHCSTAATTQIFRDPIKQRFSNRHERWWCPNRTQFIRWLLILHIYLPNPSSVHIKELLRNSLHHLDSWSRQQHCDYAAPVWPAVIQLATNELILESRDRQTDKVQVTSGTFLNSIHNIDRRLRVCHREFTNLHSRNEIRRKNNNRHNFSCWKSLVKEIKLFKTCF